MNVYFSVSIHGGREKQKDYEKLAEYIKTVGTVLNEDVVPINNAEEVAEEIYRHCTECLEQADIVICEVSVPSLGVGYEIGYAERMKKPILCLYDMGGRKTSDMILGNPYLTVEGYHTIEEAKQRVNAYFEKINSVHK